MCRHQLENKTDPLRGLHVQTPPSRAYLSAPHAGRGRESAIADYAPPTIIVEKHFSKQVHTQAVTHKCARALRDRPETGDQPRRRSRLQACLLGWLAAHNRGAQPRRSIAALLPAHQPGAPSRPTLPAHVPWLKHSAPACAPRRSLCFALPHLWRLLPPHGQKIRSRPEFLMRI